jgi:hypothetical protein
MDGIFSERHATTSQDHEQEPEGAKDILSQCTDIHNTKTNSHMNTYSPPPPSPTMTDSKPYKHTMCDSPYFSTETCEEYGEDDYFSHTYAPLSCLPTPPTSYYSSPGTTFSDIETDSEVDDGLLGMFAPSHLHPFWLSKC